MKTQFRRNYWEKGVKMSEDHRKPSCLIHFKGESGVLTRFTEISLEKFLACHELWLGLDGEQQEIPDNTTHAYR